MSGSSKTGKGALRPEALVNNADAKKYWEAVSADDNGMLGGFAFVSRADLRGSRTFLAKMGIGNKPGQRQIKRALEGGAGIGRITEGLLLDFVQEVDIVEPVAKFTEALKSKPGVRHVYNVGLEGWSPEKLEDSEEGEDGSSGSSGGSGSSSNKYGLVWTQWCTGYLNDEQFVEYLKRCRTALEPGGVVVIKENLATTDEDDFDSQDSSVTRCESSFRRIFDAGGFRLVRSELQKGFPPEAELLPVKMYALKVKEGA